MNKDPAFLLYSSDFLTGVADLTDEETGQFIKLLCYQHQKKTLSLKLIKLLCSGVPSEDVLSKFIKDTKGNYFNQRLKDVIEKRSAHSKKQKENIMKRWSKDTKAIPNKYQNNTNSIPLENEIEIENVNEIEVEIYPSFSDFWESYNKKTGKPESIKLWNKLNQTDKEEIIEYLPEYIESTPEKRFRKNPATFLNNQSWTDEITNLSNDTIKKDSKYTDSFKRKIAQKILS